MNVNIAQHLLFMSDQRFLIIKNKIKKKMKPKPVGDLCEPRLACWETD